MNSKIKFPLIIVATIVAIMFFISPHSKREQDIATPAASPAAVSPAPKTFQFDASTDLQKELESINPQVLDSDFDTE